MSNKDAYLFVSQDEFSMICENRLDDIRQKLYHVILLIREPESDHAALVNDIDQLLLKLSRVKLDMEDNARRNK